MIVIRAYIVNTVFGLIDAVRKEFGLVLERVLTEVVRLTTIKLNERILAVLHKLADCLDPPEFVRSSPLL
jgi:hypothetical protein